MDSDATDKLATPRRYRSWRPQGTLSFRRLRPPREAVGEKPLEAHATHYRRAGPYGAVEVHASVLHAAPSAIPSLHLRRLSERPSERVSERASERVSERLSERLSSTRASSTRQSKRLSRRLSSSASAGNPWGASDDHQRSTATKTHSTQPLTQALLEPRPRVSEGVTWPSRRSWDYGQTAAAAAAGSVAAAGGRTDDAGGALGGEGDGKSIWELDSPAATARPDADKVSGVHVEGRHSVSYTPRLSSAQL